MQSSDLLVLSTCFEVELRVGGGEFVGVEVLLDGLGGLGGAH